MRLLSWGLSKKNNSCRPSIRSWISWSMLSWHRAFFSQHFIDSTRRCIPWSTCTIAWASGSLQWSKETLSVTLFAHTASTRLLMMSASSPPLRASRSSKLSVVVSKKSLSRWLARLATASSYSTAVAFQTSWVSWHRACELHLLKRPHPASCSERGATSQICSRRVSSIPPA